MRRRAGLSAVLFLAACAAAVFPPSSHRMRAHDAPTPFSAGELRAACPDGTWVRFRAEAPGEPDTFLVFRFLNGGSAEVTVVTSVFDAADRLVGEPSAKRQKWTDLQSHASFPEKQARIDPAAFDTFAGRLDGWLYTVHETREGKSVLTRYAFARSLPGPPVLLEEFTDGTLARRLTMVGRGKE